MSYAGYVIAAYVVFVIVLAWDFLSPRIRIRQVLRRLRLQQRRRSTPAGTSQVRALPTQDLPR